MDNEDWKRLKEDAADILDDIDLSNMTKQSYLMFGASVAILDHKIDAGDDNDKPYCPVDRVSNSRIDELMEEKLVCFVNYMEEKGLNQTTGAELHAQYAYEALKKMLDLDYEIAQMLLNSADRKEQQLIRDTYQKISKL